MRNLDSGFQLSEAQIKKFQTDGYVKLPKFLSADTVDMLLRRTDAEMSKSLDSFTSQFNRLKYDFESDKADIYELIQAETFQQVMSALTNRNLFMTFELCFELKSGVSKGFPWHVGVQSFGYQRAEEFGCTIWAPLHPIRTDGQRGGMAYVPDRLMSGRFVYDQIESAIISTLEEQHRRGEETSLNKYLMMRAGILNSPAMRQILETHCEEDEFDPGDVLVFNKYVIHRSVKLEEGELDRRAAFVMRFVEQGSRYDRRRAEELEYPTIRYGQQPFTRAHIEIDLPDGGVLSDSEYNDSPEQRMISKT